MKNRFIIPLYDLVFSMSNIVDLTNSELSNHHEQVSYISYRLAQNLGLEVEKQKKLVLAAAIHDIGSFSKKDNLERLVFDNGNDSEHAHRAAYFVESFSPFAGLAPIIRHHHLDWNYGRRNLIKGKEASLLSNIIKLADRISLLVKKDNILAHKKDITSKIEAFSGKMFNPEFVESFLDLAQREEFWLTSTNSKIMEKKLKGLFSQWQLEFNLEELGELSKFYSRVIDFRSSFTANHSKGVALTGAYLAKFSGWSDNEAKKMEIAGYLHDLGKLAVPTDILEKPGKLSEEEFAIVRGHTFYTYYALDSIDALSDIKEWASFHHEKLNGRGYPFKIAKEGLSTGSRIMAVADIFTALTEDRPYRKGMKRDKVLSIMNSMSDNGGIDGDLVSVLEKNYTLIDHLRGEAQINREQRRKKFVLCDL